MIMIIIAIAAFLLSAAFALNFYNNMMLDDIYDIAAKLCSSILLCILGFISIKTLNNPECLCSDLKQKLYLITIQNDSIVEISAVKESQIEDE